ncbi:FAD-dependent monooxygenase [Streptomyces sp. NPDC050263]|uniref:FAD-dependent monooxygenase n=1 Tax=Streptomyces sp. NPDC050263 TaxID=3155037 RepID=UPI00341D2724
MPPGLAERFRVGWVLLAGDAAHVHPPPADRASTWAFRTRSTSAGSWPHRARSLLTTAARPRPVRASARQPSPSNGTTSRRSVHAGPRVCPGRS